MTETGFERVTTNGDDRTVRKKPRWASAALALEDGRIFWGRSIGVPGEAYGEIVFNTAMCGYPEVMTDPSYAGQIVTFTYPLIGNYGVAEEAFESHRAFCEAIVVRESSRSPSPWNAEARLNEFLEEQSIVGIEEIDTRALTRHIREKGELRAILSTFDSDPESLVEKARSSPGLVGRDLASEVSAGMAYRFDWREEEPGRVVESDAPSVQTPTTRERGRVAVYDFGVKRGILRALARRGFEVVVVPATTPAEELLSLGPRGLVLSNGPGDPASVKGGIANVRALLGKLPILGICLGHQISGLALGAETRKLKFGHHGANHPVQELRTGRISITSQNHGFVVDESTLPAGATVTHRNLNDGTLEGFAVDELQLACVQFHPEASPGPLDTDDLFDAFAARCDATQPTTLSGAS